MGGKESPWQPLVLYVVSHSGDSERENATTPVIKPEKSLFKCH